MARPSKRAAVKRLALTRQDADLLYAAIDAYAAAGAGLYGNAAPGFDVNAAHDMLDRVHALYGSTPGYAGYLP